MVVRSYRLVLASVFDWKSVVWFLVNILSFIFCEGKKDVKYGCSVLPVLFDCNLFLDFDVVVKGLEHLPCTPSYFSELKMSHLLF